jgi:hypothetical protein
MKCNEIEYLIYLNKPGEITENEQKLLNEHLSACPDCRKLRDEIHNQFVILNNFIDVLPKTQDSSYYKEQIFARINNQDKEESKDIVIKFKSRNLYYFTLPVYRYLSAAIIAALVITFLFQNYSAYLNISQLETRFGNPSSYIAAAENKAFILKKDDFSYIKESTQKGLKAGKKTPEFNWFRGNHFLLNSIRRHRFFQELANHNPGIDPSEILRIYNKSVYLGESKRNQN